MLLQGSQILERDLRIIRFFFLLCRFRSRATVPRQGYRGEFDQSKATRHLEFLHPTAGYGLRCLANLLFFMKLFRIQSESEQDFFSWARHPPSVQGGGTQWMTWKQVLRMGYSCEFCFSFCHDFYVIPRFAKSPHAHLSDSCQACNGHLHSSASIMACFTCCVSLCILHFHLCIHAQAFPICSMGKLTFTSSSVFKKACMCGCKHA